MRGKLSGEEIRLCADCWFQCAIVKPASGVMLSVLFSHSILDFSHLKNRDDDNSMRLREWLAGVSRSI